MARVVSYDQLRGALETRMTMNGQDNDESLMVRVQNGDHQAFSILVSRHTQRFYACAFRLCGQSETAEDIVQEAFLKLWSNPQNWKSNKGAKFTTWFYRVVTNLTLDMLRKKAPQGGGEILDFFSSDELAQDEVMMMSEEQKALESAIQNLPERQKVALNLCFYEGLSNKEAADILGVGVKGIESLLMRAKAGVRDELIRKNIVSLEGKYGRSA